MARGRPTGPARYETADSIRARVPAEAKRHRGAVRLRKRWQLEFEPADPIVARPWGSDMIVRAEAAERRRSKCGQ